MTGRSEGRAAIRTKAGRRANDAYLDAGLTQLKRIFNEFEQLPALNGSLTAGLEERSAGEEGLRVGVEAIQGAIKKTRHEIAALHAKGLKDRQFNRATDELDAVVADTECATESILSAAEQIDSLAAELSAELPAESKAKVAEIQDRVVRIYEACNFQDISGQRISKVVGLLHFIESCVGTMTEIWGAGEADQAPEPIDPEDDSALLNGPSRADAAGVVSQDDIDSLFR